MCAHGFLASLGINGNRMLLRPTLLPRVATVCSATFCVFCGERPHSRAPFPTAIRVRRVTVLGAAKQGRCTVPRRKPRPIDLEVKAAVEQLEPSALQKLTLFAKRGAYALALAGEPVAPDEHEQIVHDAIADTMSLGVTWNRLIKIEAHLYNVIKRRISNGLRGAKKKVRVELDVLDTEEDAAAARRGSELEAALGRAQVTQQLYRELRERAANDPEVLSMLDAYHAEVTDRREVMAWTGLTLPEVVNARRRLDRLIAGLPDELRRAALAAMRETNISQVGETMAETND